MFTFQWPYVALLLPVPLIIRYFFSTKNKLIEDEVPEINFPHIERIQNSFSGLYTGIKRNSLYLLSLSVIWTLLVIALMRPQIVDQLNDVRTEGHDLMLAVDLSQSMQSLDFQSGDTRLSRLDVAKKVVKDFVNKREGDRIGLILFGEHAYLRAPLTLDTAAISEMLNNSLSGMAGDATAIGDAIGLAVKNLRDRPAKSRAIILLTDGEDNSSTIPPIQAAEIAKQYGIHIYTIVIGKDGVVPFPDPKAGIVMVESHVDTALTRKIAEITGGEFYRSTDEKSLERIYNRIDELEKTKSEVRHILIRKPLFHYPMGLALVIMFSYIFATLLRRNSYELN